jgi:hypothetical protein
MSSNAADGVDGLEPSMKRRGVAPRVPLEFAWISLRIFCVFFLGGVLLAFAIDAIFLAASVLFELAGYRNFVGRQTSGLISAFPFLILTAPVAYAAAQFTSAVLALLSYAIVKRVVLWWVVITTPLVAYRFGFSIFADLYWKSGGIGKEMVPLANFLTVCAIQGVVAMSCWWWSQRSRPATSLPGQHERDH